MLQGYVVTYSVHPSTDGLPTIALYSACTTIQYTNTCNMLYRHLQNSLVTFRSRPGYSSFALSSNFSFEPSGFPLYATAFICLLGDTMHAPA